MNTDALGTVLATLIKSESIMTQCFLNDNEEEEEFGVLCANEFTKIPAFTSVNTEEDFDSDALSDDYEDEITQDEVITILAGPSLPHISKDKKRKSELEKMKSEPKIPVHMLSDFKTQFKMTTTTYERILSTFKPNNEWIRKMGRPSVPFHKQLLVVIWMLVNQEPFRIISQRFEVPKSSIVSFFKRVIDLLKQSNSQFITWPKESVALETVKGFKEISGLSNVIGAINNIHINIKSSRTPPEEYINKEGSSTIIFQATTDHNMLFTSCYAKSPGSMTAEEVFETSPLSIASDTFQVMFPDGSYLIGPVSYPLSTYLITPFDQDILTVEQEHFNNALNEALSPVIKALKLFKARFQRLTLLEMTRLDLIPDCITIACIIHNICILNNDLIDIPGDDDKIDSDERASVMSLRGIGKRNRLANELFHCNDNNS